MPIYAIHLKNIFICFREYFEKRTGFLRNIHYVVLLSLSGNRILCILRFRTSRLENALTSFFS